MTGRHWEGPDHDGDRRHVSGLSRQYAKLCDPRDFDDPELIEAIRALVPERDPYEHIERKVWEYAMVMLFLADTGHLDRRSRVLSVGAGNERILFWLTNHVGRMVATDVYGHGPFAAREAQASMLTDPAAHAPAYEWRAEALEVHRMDARRLIFPDASFDAVFTVSSIEHFGTPRDVAQAAAEIGRVLRPGGHALIITEFLVRHHPLDRAVGFLARVRARGRTGRDPGHGRRPALEEVFTPPELESLLVGPSGLAEMQQLDTRTSDQAHPRIRLYAGHSSYTSVCLPLVKPT
jgi:SAM-dependent methyltransferase